MPCPVNGRFTTQLFQQAMNNLDLWQAAYCSFAAPLGELVVGSIIYGGFSLNIFIRTGSLILPLILALIFGGTVLGQTFGIINSIVGILVLVVAPLLITAIIYMVDR